MKVHESITPDRVLAACEAHVTSLDDIGFCLECGAEAHGVEPDAEHYRCEACGAPQVFGAEEILIGEMWAPGSIFDVISKAAKPAKD